MYGRTAKLNWHLLTQGLDQKVDTIASHTVREGILETNTRLMLGIDVYPRPHLSASARLRLRNIKLPTCKKLKYCTAADLNCFFLLKITPANTSYHKHRDVSECLYNMHDMFLT